MGKKAAGSILNYSTETAFLYSSFLAVSSQWVTGGNSPNTCYSFGGDPETGINSTIRKLALDTEVVSTASGVLSEAGMDYPTSISSGERSVIKSRNAFANNFDFVTESVTSISGSIPSSGHYHGGD